MYWQLTVTALFIQSIGASCPNGWQTHDQTCYLFSHGREEWPGAYEMCKIMGGKLVEIETAAENNFLYQQIKDIPHHFWIGLSDSSEEGTWVWMTSQTPSKDQFTNWYPSQPSRVDGKGEPENCAEFFHNNGQWNDAACSTLYYYICEKQDTESEIVG